jgi:iron complex transport system substrate-binding protein
MIKNRRASHLITLGLCIFISGALAAQTAAKTISVTDLGGRNVELPATIKRVACLVGPSYEKVFLLGQKDKVAMRMGTARPWALRTNPAFSSIPSTNAPRDPNVEELIAKKIDLVFFWDYPEPIAKMTASGIPVLSTVANSKEPETMADFIAFKKKEINLYGSALGTEAQAKAEEYNAYFDAKIKFVTSRTSKIPEGQRPKVYYVLGPDALTTFGKNSYPQRYIEMAGGLAGTRVSSFRPANESFPRRRDHSASIEEIRVRLHEGRSPA